MDGLRQSSVVTGFRRLLYFVSPNETSFKTIEDVPKYVDEAIPFFVAMIVLEIPILFLQGKKIPRFNDGFSSVANGILSLLHNLLFRSVELASYIWVFERFNMVELPWNSPWTWLAGFLGVDFGYYWVHRCGHEVNIMWAGHQVHHSSEDYNFITALRQSAIHKYTGWCNSFVRENRPNLLPIILSLTGEINIMWAAHQTHHSSEDYNLTTALRQSCILRYMSWIFYLPLALFVPPSVFLVHSQFNLLYQFWIHTETIEKLGPLEYILNTPSHHRVHHGRNRYCIDKNYGGTLIIFDRMFGTFEAEKEEVVYGVVHPLNSWDPLYSQFCHLIHMWRTFRNVEGINNKMSVIWKGPGWAPGKPRLGQIEDIPDIHAPTERFDHSLPLWTNLYIWLHILLALAGYSSLSHNKEVSPVYMTVLGIVFIIYTLSCFGALYDHKKSGPVMEFIRCGSYCAFIKYINPAMFGNVIYFVFVISLLVWGSVCIRQYSIKVRAKKA